MLLAAHCLVKNSFESVVYLDAEGLARQVSWLMIKHSAGTFRHSVTEVIILFQLRYRF
jgi:hypothetical protein